MIEVQVRVDDDVDAREIEVLLAQREHAGIEVRDLRMQLRHAGVDGEFELLPGLRLVPAPGPHARPAGGRPRAGGALALIGSIRTKKMRRLSSLSMVARSINQTARRRHQLTVQASSSSPITTSYDSWVQSNVRIIPADQQEILREARVLIAGTGAEGSSAAVCLARLGVGHFRLADLDKFEAKNLNRQFGCYHDTLGVPKVDAVAAEIQRINPEAEVEVTRDGVTAENARALVENVSCIVEGIDMYVPEAVLALDQAAREAELFMVTGVSLGFRNDIYVFSPRGMGLVEFCLDAVARGHYPFVTYPVPPGFPADLATAMTQLFNGLPDPSESLELFLPAFKERVANTADLAIPAIAPTIFLTGARTAVEVYGLLTGTREPVLAPGYTSVDLLNVAAETVRAA
jgi:molybdopterin/thiamine biosynthesis adenylyltransferase